MHCPPSGDPWDCKVRARVKTDFDDGQVSARQRSAFVQEVGDDDTVLWTTAWLSRDDAQAVVDGRAVVSASSSTTARAAVCGHAGEDFGSRHYGHRLGDF